MRDRLLAIGDLLLHNWWQLLIALDCAANVFACMATGRKAYASETLSAHAWRSRQKVFGAFFLPLIDGLFFWQKPDPTICDDSGVPIKSHCWRAYMRLRMKQYLPPEYSK